MQRRIRQTPHRSGSVAAELRDEQQRDLDNQKRASDHGPRQLPHCHIEPHTTWVCNSRTYRVPSNVNQEPAAMLLIAAPALVS